jgi:hypothetical protein
MKRLLLIAMISVASITLKASHQLSELNLRLTDGHLFTVAFDHLLFNNPSGKFNLKDIEPGTHYIRVYRINPGYYNPYDLPVMIFSGNINIPAAVRINAVIDRQHRFRVNKIVPLAPPVVYAPYPPPYISHTQVYGMHEQEFQNLKATVENMNFESSRLTVIKQALSANYITSRQVAELMSLMSFESGKLDVAKFAFSRTVDRENYYIVNDQFWFESSIMELNRYITSG